MGDHRRLPTGPMRCGNSMPKASVNRPLPGNWGSAEPQCDGSSAKLQCRFLTRKWRTIYGYKGLTGMLTVNFPSITPGAPSRQESLGEGDSASMFETSHRDPVGHQSHPVRVSRPPEASLASSSVMAARSVDSECKSRVIEPRNKGWSQEPSPLGSWGNIDSLYWLGEDGPAGV